MRHNSTDSSSIYNFKQYSNAPNPNSNIPIHQHPYTPTPINKFEENKSSTMHQHPHDFVSESDSLLHSLVSHDDRMGTGPIHKHY